MKNTDIMFSVEVITYNQKDYIAQTLQSILDQKHNYKYEILVSDDCSTDGTQDIIKQFHKKYPDIIKPVYNEKNLGAMKNYYATVSRAQGKYLMECAGDDYWLSGKVEKQISFMERNLDFDLCYGKAKIVNQLGNFENDELGEGYIFPTDALLKGVSAPALTLCFRRDFFIKYLEEIKPQDKVWLMEDYPFIIYAFFESKVYFMNDALAVYRIIKNSLSHQESLIKMYKFDKNTWEIKKFFADKYSYDIPQFSDESELYYHYKQLLNRNNKRILKKEYKDMCNELALSANYAKRMQLKNIIHTILKFLLPYSVVTNIKKYSNKNSSK